MSRHSYPVSIAGGQGKVLAGWSCSMGGYYLKVLDGQGQPIYSNLQDTYLNWCKGFPATFDYFSNVLTVKGLLLPHSILVELQYDKIMNANRCKFYNEAGISIPDPTPADASQ